jgi:hypothetical protein
MDDYDKDIKVDAKLDSYKGILKIDILDVLNQLDENTKKEFLSDAGWRSLVTQEMVKLLIIKPIASKFTLPHLKKITKKRIAPSKKWGSEWEDNMWNEDTGL